MCKRLSASKFFYFQVPRIHYIRLWYCLATGTIVDFFTLLYMNFWVLLIYLNPTDNSIQRDNPIQCYSYKYISQFYDFIIKAIPLKLRIFVTHRRQCTFSKLITLYVIFNCCKIQNSIGCILSPPMRFVCSQLITNWEPGQFCSMEM